MQETDWLGVVGRIRMRLDSILYRGPHARLLSRSGDRYCALTCFLDSGCPDGAKCGKPSGLFGVCYYPESKPTASAVMMKLAFDENEAEMHV